MTEPQEKQKVRDFIQMNVKPFTTKQCSASTGVNIHSVREYMKKFCNEGVVQVVATEGQRKIYSRIKDKKLRRKIKLKKAAQWISENKEFYKMRMCS